VGLLARLLRPHVRTLDAKTARALREAAVARLSEGKPATTWEPLLQAAREADAAKAAEALRAAGAKLRKTKPERALAAMRVLGRAPRRRPTTATPSRRSSSPRAAATRRSRSSASSPSAASISRRRCAAIRALDAETRYQIGFHFAERRHPVGEEILGAVAEAGGRTKVGQMARAKLRSSATRGNEARRPRGSVALLAGHAFRRVGGAARIHRIG